MFVYDRSRNVFVVHGGLDDARNVLGDTWEYDGSNWNEVTSARDLPLWDHGGAWSETLQGVIMFGGLTPEIVQPQDTWVLRNGDWELVPTENSPPVRRDTRIIYDGDHGRNLLFGGWDTDGGLDGVNDDDFGDLWQLRVLIPQEQIQDVIDGVQELVGAGALSQDEAEDVIAKLGTAVEELDKPDNQAALGSIEDAVGELESAGLDPDVGFALMDQLAGIAREIAAQAIDEAIACDPTNSDIADAQQVLNDGDELRATDAFKDTVNKYKDALAKAEGVVSSCS